MHYTTRLLICLLFNSALTFAQTTGTYPFTLAQDSAYVRDKYRKQEVMVPMRDGTKLFTQIYTPKTRAQSIRL